MLCVRGITSLALSLHFSLARVDGKCPLMYRYPGKTSHSRRQCWGCSTGLQSDAGFSDSVLSPNPVQGSCNCVGCIVPSHPGTNLRLAIIQSCTFRSHADSTVALPTSGRQRFDDTSCISRSTSIWALCFFRSGQREPSVRIGSCTSTICIR